MFLFLTLLTALTTSVPIVSEVGIMRSAGVKNSGTTCSSVKERVFVPNVNTIQMGYFECDPLPTFTPTPTIFQPPTPTRVIIVITGSPPQSAP